MQEVSEKLQREMDQSMRNALAMGEFMDMLSKHLEPKPERPRTRFAYLILTDGRCIGTNHYGDCALNHTNEWAWIVGHMVDEFGCDPDAVHIEEGGESDEHDWITIDGTRVGYLKVE